MDRGTPRAKARLAALTALALLTTSIGLAAPVAAAPPANPPTLVNDAGEAGAHGSAPASVRDLGRGPADALGPSGRSYVPGVVLVSYRDGASAAERGAARRAAKTQSHKSVSKLAPSLERLQLEPGTSVESAVRALHGRKGVRFAEPDYTITTDFEPNDGIYAADLMWGMYGLNSNPPSAYGYGIAAGEAWNVSQIGSRDVYVAVIDTGIDIGHKDLAPNIWTNPFETAGNGIDDDGNGYVDDIHGWDFFHNDASVFDAASADYHGTHVAGTIGAAGSNAEGVVGVNWSVTMIPAKFIHGEGSVSGAIAAIDYVTDLKVNHGLNIVATNNSWGGAEESQALQDAINRGGDADILFVASAGNDGKNIDAAPVFPVSHTCDTRYDTGDTRGFDCLISVAAITETGARAAFSNYGATSVDIGAPGQEIASTYPGNDYVYLNGTSMAAPHVTGSLALLAACQASPTPDGLQASLFDHAVATPSLAGITTTEARVNVAAMLADCDTGGPPRVYITPFAGGTDTPAQFWAFFSESVSGLDAGDFSLGGSSTGWAIDQIQFGPDWYYIAASATSPPVGTLTLTLAAGSVTGASQAGPADPVTAATLIDRTAPTMTKAPAATIRSGANLAGSAIPLQLTWAATDAESGVRFYEIDYSTSGGQSWYSLTDYHVGAIAYVNVPISSASMKFRVRAYDWAGHISPTFPAGPTFLPRLAQEGNSAISYSGSWSLGKSSKFSGGRVRYTGVGGRTATYSFTGRAVALVTTLALSRGVVKIKLDGVLVARIDLGKPLSYRRLVWQKTFAAVKAHKVKIIVIGGYGRVDLDAFAVLK